MRARTIQRLGIVRDRCCCLAFDLEETPEAGGAGRPRNTRTEHATQKQTSTFGATAALVWAYNYRASLKEEIKDQSPR